MSVLPQSVSEPSGPGPLDRLFGYCNSQQVREYLPEKRSIRIHGHSTTVRLERAFWSVLDEMAREEGVTVAALVTRIHDHCLSSNDKNLASCLRVVSLKYINLGVNLIAGENGRGRKTMSVTVLDVKGLNCPLPILRTKKAIKDVAMDNVLQVLATDPGSVKDMEAFCRQTGNELLGWKDDGGTYVFDIKRKG